MSNDGSWLFTSGISSFNEDSHLFTSGICFVCVNLLSGCCYFSCPSCSCVAETLDRSAWNYTEAGRPSVIGHSDELTVDTQERRDCDFHTSFSQPSLRTWRSSPLLVVISCFRWGRSNSSLTIRLCIGHDPLLNPRGITNGKNQLTPSIFPMSDFRYTSACHCFVSGVSHI